MRRPPCRMTPEGQTVVWDWYGAVVIHAWATPEGVCRYFVDRASADRDLARLGWETMTAC